jgi:hypothetical protein
MSQETRSQRLSIAAGGDFIMSSPELQLGFVLKVEDKNFCLALFVSRN